MTDEYVYPDKFKVVLGGIVGSQAQGFATKASDTDRGFVFVAPTLDLLGLTPPEPSVQLHDPDMWGHEIGKFIRLALTCNPTILELLWVDHDVCSSYAGRMLVMHRAQFLSAHVLYGAYKGYAKQQIVRAEAEHRTVKARRHCLRLLLQGAQALRDGYVTVKPSSMWVTNIRTASETSERFIELYTHLAEDLDDAYASTKLPAEPDREMGEFVLRQIRKHVIDRETAQ